MVTQPIQLNRYHKKSLILGLWMLLALLMTACNLSATSAPTATPLPELPTVEFLSPPNNSRVIEGVDFDLDIFAKDAGAGIARLELYVDDEIVNDATPQAHISVPELRVTMNWLAEGTGFHVLSVVAYRLDGTRSDEALLTVEVVPE